VSAGFDLAGAVITSAISGYFGDKANKREMAAARESEQNKVYMMSLKRQWDLADRRYLQENFGKFRQYAKKDWGPAGPMVDPNSITPINPYGGTRDGGVRGGASVTGQSPVAGSPNPSGMAGAPGARPQQQTTSPSWRAGP
jgi:hypothetical protein